MTLCPRCQELTENNKHEIKWNSIFKLIVIHCSRCYAFKYQYLEKGKDE